MPLDQAMEAVVSRNEALRELRKHGVEDFSEFFEDVGDRPSYVGCEVLNWLGY